MSLMEVQQICRRCGNAFVTILGSHIVSHPIGGGYRPEFDGDYCPECNKYRAKKYYEAEKQAAKAETKKERCSACEGSGHVGRNRMTCIRCDGKGWVRHTPTIYPEDKELQRRLPSDFGDLPHSRRPF